MELFISGFFLSLSLCLDLGFVNVALLRAGVQRGMLPALLIGIGSSFGDLVYAVLSMLGISLLLNSLLFKWILWIGGTAILLYMTWSMVKELYRPKELQLDAEEGAPRSLLKDFTWGIGLALASPSAILWFATIGGSVIAASQADHHSNAALLQFFGGFFSASIMWSILLSGIASQGGKLMGPKLVRGFSFLSAVLFLYFAGKVFMNGLETLL